MIRPVISGVAMMTIWGFITTAYLSLPFAPALACFALSALLFVAWHFHPGRPRRRRHLVRLRVRGGVAGWGWFGGLIGLTAVMAVSFSVAFVVTLRPHGARASEVAAILARQGGPLLLLLGAGLMGPLVEESIYRGYLQRRLEKSLGAGIGILLTTTLFAVQHGLDPAPIPQFVLGLLLGYAAHRSRSIWPSFVMHGATNAAIVGSSIARRFGLVLVPAHPGPLFACAAWALAGVSATALVQHLRQLRPQGSTDRFRTRSGPEALLVPVGPATADSRRR